MEKWFVFKRRSQAGGECPWGRRSYRTSDKELRASLNRVRDSRALVHINVHCFTASYNDGERARWGTTQPSACPIAGDRDQRLMRSEISWHCCWAVSRKRRCKTQACQRMNERMNETSAGRWVIVLYRGYICEGALFFCFGLSWTLSGCRTCA